MAEFSDQVFAQVQRIPRGKVATYGQIARLVGRPRSARYVGFALRANPAPGQDASLIPCHRVVFKDGSLCRGFAFGGPEVQRAMLEEEGVAFADEDHVDMGTCQWDPGEGAAGAPAAGASGEAIPTAPPPGFDWSRELGEL
ncbi:MULTISPECIES: MGMT family protein [unclassified Adlercreutzia]|uniref:MGMT family protein n=1 Tax=unclassified Adlercreutzia TaxID=2636013 RepID=UPI0013ED3A7B|nr:MULTISPECIES: MGMT family protein [unclassified Adlercreutzia]